ncbi:MAG TPA: hypothetical protein VK696_00820 [Steroidobacteraceae bacterium]|nr:hypothetical protein [Steroidobacteraceae bacterium]
MMRTRQFVRSELAAAASWPLSGLASVLRPVGDVPAMGLAGSAAALRGTDIEALAASLRGEVLLAGSSEYDRARRVRTLRSTGSRR